MVKMRFPEIVHMTDDGAGPVWAQKRRRSGSPPVVGFLVGLLALFGTLVLVLSVMDRSVAEAGARVDGWIGKGLEMVGGATEKAPEAAEKAADEAGQAAEKSGEAVEAGPAAAATGMKKAG